jgi:hypothetical protein
MPQEVNLDHEVDMDHEVSLDYLDLEVKLDHNIAPADTHNPPPLILFAGSLHCLPTYLSLISKHRLQMIHLFCSPPPMSTYNLLIRHSQPL